MTNLSVSANKDSPILGNVCWINNWKILIILGLLMGGKLDIVIESTTWSIDEKMGV